MKTTPRSEADAKRASRPELLRPGWTEGEIREASEHRSQRGNHTIELFIAIAAPDGAERLFKDWLTSAPLGALKLRHAVEAVGALAQYDAGEISANSFVGHLCRVRIAIEKKRGYPDRNIIIDYAAANSRVDYLREVAP